MWAIQNQRKTVEGTDYDKEYAKFTADHEFSIRHKDSSLRNSTRFDDYLDIHQELISPSRVHVAIGERKNSIQKV